VKKRGDSSWTSAGERESHRDPLVEKKEGVADREQKMTSASSLKKKEKKGRHPPTGVGRGKKKERLEGEGGDTEEKKTRGSSRTLGKRRAIRGMTHTVFGGK